MSNNKETETHLIGNTLVDRETYVVAWVQLAIDALTEVVPIRCPTTLGHKGMVLLMVCASRGYFRQPISDQEIYTALAVLRLAEDSRADMMASIRLLQEKLNSEIQRGANDFVSRQTRRIAERN